MTEIVILGAGPAGLMAALTAARAGHRCTVIEASDAVGGMAGGFEVAGQRVDFGSHRLHPASPPEVLDLIGDLLGTDLQVRPRAGRLRLADRWLGFPLQTTELARTLPPRLTARLMTDAAATTARGLIGRTTPSSFEEEVTSRLGRTVTERFYGPYARKLYGRDPADLDRELAVRRVSAASPTDIARRLIRATRPTGRTFLYPRLGYGQITDRLAEAAVDAGATIHLGERAEAVSVDPDRTRVRTSRRSLDAEVALSTIPVGTLASILSPTPPTAVVDAIGVQQVRAMLLVYVVLDRPQYTPFDAHYIPAPPTRIARLSEPKNYRDGDDPGDRTVLCAEIPCDRDDELTRMTPSDLGAMVADDLHRIDLPDATPSQVEVRLLPSVYPVYDRGGGPRRAIVDQWIAGLDDRLLSLGRQGLGVIDNLHHVMAMGSEAVRSIGPDGRVDGERWRQRLAGFANHTVED